MRPKSIVMFERVVIISILLGIVNSVVTWDKLAADAAAQGMGTDGIFAVQGVMIAINLLLLWFIARKGSPVAKWIYVVVTAIALIAGVVGLGQMMEFGVPSLLLSLISYALGIYSLWLLFRPDSKAFFADGRGEAA